MGRASFEQLWIWSRHCVSIMRKPHNADYNVEVSVLVGSILVAEHAVTGRVPVSGVGDVQASSASSAAAPDIVGRPGRRLCNAAVDNELVASLPLPVQFLHKTVKYGCLKGTVSKATPTGKRRSQGKRSVR